MVVVLGQVDRMVLEVVDMVDMVETILVVMECMVLVALELTGKTPLWGTLRVMEQASVEVMILEVAMVDLTRVMVRITAVVLLILVGMRAAMIWALALDTLPVVEAPFMEVEEEEEDMMAQGVLQVVVIILMGGSN